MTGDIHLAFDRPIPATETAGAPAAEAAETAALEAVFARCVFAQMFTPPPPPGFSSPARNRASLFRFNPPRLRRVAARPEHKPLSDGAPNATGEWASPLPTDSARPPSLIPTVAARDAPLGARLVGATPRISTQAHASHPVGRRPGDGFALHTPGG